MPARLTTRHLRAALAGGCLWLCLPVAAAPLRYSGHAGLSYDSNPSNVREGGKDLPDRFATAGLSTEASRPLGSHAQGLLRGSLGGEAYAEHDQLSQGRALLLARLSVRPDDAFYTPLLAVWASAAYAEFGSAIRDGAEYRGGLYLSEALTTALSARLGAQLSRRYARGAAFDLSGHSLLANLDWSGAPWTAYLGYQYYDGDLVSTTLPTAALAGAASASEPDDAFDAGLFAHRLDSRADLYTLGFNYAFSPRYALDTQWQRIAARAHTGVRYERQFLSISLLLRF